MGVFTLTAQLLPGPAVRPVDIGDATELTFTVEPYTDRAGILVAPRFGIPTSGTVGFTVTHYLELVDGTRLASVTERSPDLFVGPYTTTTSFDAFFAMPGASVTVPVDLHSARVLVSGDVVRRTTSGDIAIVNGPSGFAPATVTTTPEPSTLVLALVGALLWKWFRSYLGVAHAT